MGTLKQWLGWVVCLGVVPTAGLLVFAQHMRQNELGFYLLGTPPLLLYFYVMGRLGVDVPGKLEKRSSEAAVHSSLSFSIRARQLGRTVMGWLQAAAVLLGMPIMGAGLIFYGVRDGEFVGYILGPAMIWVSGGTWSLGVQFLRRRRVEAAQAGCPDQHDPTR